MVFIFSHIVFVGVRVKKRVGESKQIIFYFYVYDIQGRLNFNDKILVNTEK